MPCIRKTSSLPVFVEKKEKKKVFCFPFNAQNVTSFQGFSYSKICSMLPFTDKVISKVSITHEKLKATLSCSKLLTVFGNSYLTSIIWMIIQSGLVSLMGYLIAANIYCLLLNK